MYSIQMYVCPVGLHIHVDMCYIMCMLQMYEKMISL